MVTPALKPRISGSDKIREKYHWHSCPFWWNKGIEAITSTPLLFLHTIVGALQAGAFGIPYCGQIVSMLPF
jgi:hypothetical protein